MNKVIVKKEGFSDDSDPITDLGIGIWHIVDSILYENHNCLKWCYGKVSSVDENICLIQIQKENLVLESLRVEEIKKHGVSEVKLNPQNGTCYTILDQLRDIDMYLRIKVFYEKVLIDCLGLPPLKQEEYLYGNSEERSRKNLKHVPLRVGWINETANYIRNLSNDPSPVQIKELCEKVLDLELVYAYYAKDDFSVEMNWYAKALIRRL